jgi:hypothetical protein
MIPLYLQTGLSAIHCAAHYGQVDFVREMLTKVPATVKSEHPGGGDSGLKDLGTEVGDVFCRSLVTCGLILVSQFLNLPCDFAHFSPALHPFIWRHNLVTRVWFVCC